MTAERCEHCGVVVSADHQQVWRDRSAQAWCWNGLTRHDVPVNRTLVERSPMLGWLRTNLADPWGRGYES